MISTKLASFHPLLDDVVHLAKRTANYDYKALSDKLFEIERAAVQRAIALMLNEIYDFDLDSLTVDIAKIQLLNADKVVEVQDRKKLLRALWWIVSVYFEGDIKKAVETCNSVRRFK